MHCLREKVVDNTKILIYLTKNGLKHLNIDKKCDNWAHFCLPKDLILPGFPGFWEKLINATPRGESSQSIHRCLRSSTPVLLPDDTIVAHNRP